MGRYSILHAQAWVHNRGGNVLNILKRYDMNGEALKIFPKSIASS